MKSMATTNARTATAVILAKANDSAASANSAQQFSNFRISNLEKTVREK
jgi:hypothetical protein